LLDIERKIQQAYQGVIQQENRQKEEQIAFWKTEAKAWKELMAMLNEEFQALKRWNVNWYAELTEFKQREANLYGRK
jgi:hypothetical protein